MLTARSRLSRRRLGTGAVAVTVLVGLVGSLTALASPGASVGADVQATDPGPGQYANPLLPRVPGDGAVESCADPVVLRGRITWDVPPGSAWCRWAERASRPRSTTSGCRACGQDRSFRAGDGLLVGRPGVPRTLQPPRGSAPRGGFRRLQLSCPTAGRVGRLTPSASVLGCSVAWRPAVATQ